MEKDNDFLKSYKKNNIENKEKEVEKGNEDMVYEEKDSFKPPVNNNQTNSYANKGKHTLRNSIIWVCILAIIISVGVFVVLPSLNKIDVVDFSGWNRNDFMLWISQNDLFAQIEEEYNDEIEEDRIISQSIKEGEKINKGTFVQVLISKGADLSLEVVLPDIINMTKLEIDEWETENLMTKIRTSTEYSETIPVGKVIRFEINDDTIIDKVKRDTPVYIVFSKGKELVDLPEITVPDFKMMSVNESILFARDNDFVLIVKEQNDDYIDKGRIASQSINYDEIIHPGDEITIIVSLGQKIFMPNFFDISKDEAIVLAQSLGITLNIEEIYSSFNKDRLITQSINNGVEIVDDMKLTLKYSLGNRMTIDNYIGSNIFSIEQWVESQNEKDADLQIVITYTQNAATSGTILQQDVKNNFITMGSKINLIVSSGRSYFVPNFVATIDSNYDKAITIERAEALANGLDVILVFVPEVNKNRLQGEVWAQSILVGTQVAEGQIITLKYNPVTDTITIPDFTGKTKKEIEQMDEFKALYIKYDYEFFVGRVYEQSLEEGSIVPYGTEITLSQTTY